MNLMSSSMSSLRLLKTSLRSPRESGFGSNWGVLRWGSTFLGLVVVVRA